MLSLFCGSLIWGAKFVAAYDDAKMRDLMKPELQWEIENSRALCVQDVQQAIIDRTAWYDMALGLFERFDYLAMPSAQVFPFAIEKRWPEQIADRKMDSYHRWIEVMVPGTLTGCPIMSLPVGFNPAGLPMGVQIIGRPRGDLSVLQLTHLYEALTPSMKAAPPAAQLHG